MKENIALNKSVNFSVGIRNYCSALYSKKETMIANQLLRSGMASARIYLKCNKLKVGQILFIK
jgi:hypothetical protein